MRTALTDRLGIEHPILNAPMTPMAGGALAEALTAAGGFGMYGIGSADTHAHIERQLGLIASETFGIGLVAWVLEGRPELLDLAIAAKPALIAISFGDVRPYAQRVRAAGIAFAVQVQDREKALAAADAGADFIVAQGTEAGGHTGSVGTLPLLQIVLDAVDVPVIAAGGIATGRGLAAVLAAGACGAWIGTPFLLAREALTSTLAREHVARSDERSTVLTDVFDAATGAAWPKEFKGRAIANGFSRRWDGARAELERDAGAIAAFAAARAQEDYAVAHVYAGQTVAYATHTRPAAEIIEEIVAGARARLAAIAALA